MKVILKKIISSNILLYYFWFKLIRQRKGNDVDFFQYNTDLYIDGYPRSGNTFVIHLIKDLLPMLNVVHHLHAVAPIKIAFLFDIPVFILIRKPMECISSNYLKYYSMRGLEIDTEIDKNLLDQLIMDYIFYYDFVKENLKKISVVQFELLINEPNLILSKIPEKLGIITEINNQDLLNSVDSYKGGTNKMGEGLPNQKKERYKSIVKEHIVESDKYSYILNLYDSIISHT